MALLKLMWKKKQAWKLSLVGAGAFLFIIPSAGATELIKIGETVRNSPSESPLQLAQNSCPDRAGGGLIAGFYETDNFYVYICQGDRLYYHGIDKKTDRYITLPVNTEQGRGYVARNGDYTYIINGEALSIYRNGSLVQKDDVYKR
ncbi:MAG: hypothetical protein LDL41_06185 [Coleofasciculus sp. S288]|nr:hypothetical protein [Coleofasciculus sp. S288]